MPAAVVVILDRSEPPQIGLGMDKGALAPHPAPNISAAPPRATASEPRRPLRQRFPILRRDPELPLPRVHVSTNVLEACTLGSLPTVLRSGPYRFFFYSADQDEPRHVHIERDRAKAKFWLEPVRLETSRGFGRAELGRIQTLVEENTDSLVRSWHEYFGF